MYTLAATLDYALFDCVIGELLECFTSAVGAALLAPTSLPDTGASR